MPPPPFPMTLARRSAVAAAAAVAASSSPSSTTTTTTPDDSSNSSSIVLQNDNSNNHISRNTSSLNRDNSGNGNPNGTPPSSSSSSPITTGSTTKYHPSIFRYTCRGRLTLDSMTTKNHAGVCHGIQSQLEHVDHWRTTTEEEAIQWFQAKAAWNEGSTTTPAGPGGAPATASDTAGVGNTAAHALQTAHISNVLVYPSQLQQPPISSSNNNNNNNKYKNPHAQKLVAFTKNPSILPPTKEQWGCYGSTEIDLLVLRPQHSKEEKIVAVSPYCAPGMTIRDVTLPDTQGKERTSTIRLGILEILYQSTMEEDEEEEEVDELEDHDEEDDEMAATNTTNTATTTPTSNKEEEVVEEEVSNKSKKKKKRKHTNNDDDAESNKSFITKFWKCSQNVWKHMQSNAHLLYQATQEDFVSRTKEASQKIVQEFPKTRDRTLNLMRKVIFWDWDSPEGEDDDSPPTGGGPPPIV